MTSSSDISYFFYQLRGVAILSVAYAHLPAFASPELSKVASMIGLIGVPLFLFCSGYFFRKSAINGLFFRRKFHSLLCPWLIWGSITFVAAVAYGNRSLQPIDFVHHIMGYYSWLYYVPMYFCILLLYNAVSSKYLNVIAIVACLFSCILSCFDFFSFFDRWFTFYQNPFNFIGFFAIGKMLRESNRTDLLLNKPKLWQLLLAVSLLVLSGALLWMSGSPIRYINPLCILFELSAIVAIVYIRVLYGRMSLLCAFGKNSYLIYFLHMQFGKSIAKMVFSILGIDNEVFIILFMPLSIVFITLCMILLMGKVLELARLRGWKRPLGIID